MALLAAQAGVSRAATGTTPVQRRDVKNQVYSAKMNAQLKAFDPSTQAMRIRDMSLAPESPGNAIDQSAEQDKPPSSPRATSTTPDDRVPAAEQREVDQLRQQRMQAMLRRRRNTMAAVDAGYGAYRDVTATEAQVQPPVLPPSPRAAAALQPNDHTAPRSEPRHGRTLHEHHHSPCSAPRCPLRSASHHVVRTEQTCMA